MQSLLQSLWEEWPFTWHGLGVPAKEKRNTLAASKYYSPLSHISISTCGSAMEACPTQAKSEIEHFCLQRRYCDRIWLTWWRITPLGSTSSSRLPLMRAVATTALLLFLSPCSQQHASAALRALPGTDIARLLQARGLTASRGTGETPTPQKPRRTNWGRIGEKEVSLGQCWSLQLQSVQAGSRGDKAACSWASQPSPGWKPAPGQNTALGWGPGQLWEQDFGVLQGSGRAPASGEREGKQGTNARAHDTALPASSCCQSRAAQLSGHHGCCTDLAASPEFPCGHQSGLQLKPKEYWLLSQSAGTEIAHSYQQNTW